MLLLLIAYDVAFRILDGAWVGDDVGTNTRRMRFKRHTAVDGNHDVPYRGAFRACKILGSTDFVGIGSVLTG